MAIVKYGAVITEIKGKVSGSVFQRCGQSLSLRSNPSHRKASTSFGSVARNNFAFVANYWQSLSQAQKDVYASVASSYPTLDKFGEPIILTGFQLFVYLNRVLRLVTSNLVDDAVSYSPPGIITVDCDPFRLATQSFIFYSDLPLPANCAVLLYVSECYNSAPLFNSVKYHFCCALNADFSAGEDLFLQVFNSFRRPCAVGQVFFWRTLLQNKLTGCYIADNSAMQIVTNT